MLSSLAVGYFQYLNAYQEKVSSQAKEDMTLATATFTEISRAFSEMQALQQTLYSDFTRAVSGQIRRQRPGAGHQERARDFGAL